MKVEWKGPVGGVHWCETGLLLLSVTEQRNGWMIVVDNADTGAVCASEDGFVGTLDEAKRRAFQTGMELLAPFVDAARAEERGSIESNRPHCTWCDAPAVCIATSEGDPYMFACDEHCGHGDEEGAHAFLSDPAAMLAIINGLHARVAELEEDDDRARAEEREACAKVADDLAKDYEGRAELPHAKNTALWGQRMTQACVASEVSELIRARAKDGAK